MPDENTCGWCGMPDTGGCPCDDPRDDLVDDLLFGDES